ncbi:MAG: hypothetical protein C4520_13875 [Candidatus Abyssobacteria bacterium SURF_5]|uniref:Uncharacterized protein n=1 Tax=Abyssobacteria bacterium (strain SURF_5) TaxID=2093360 RepID=A0A3A4NBD6_ABYX5|nr:MAG: hypothetical protein C4520_13875 [Candidatus Abyssubacteria bacterium SURF_5]
MKVPEYVTVEEVRRVCKELGIRDWTKLKQLKVQPKEARAILARVNPGKMKIALEDFRAGLEVELEHGTRFPDANVTNNHPILTGKIVMAHFKESLDYYQRLEVAELEGDLLKAIRAGKTDKIKGYYKRLVKARNALSQVEFSQLK